MRASYLPRKPASGPKALFRFFEHRRNQTPFNIERSSVFDTMKAQRIEPPAAPLHILRSRERECKGGMMNTIAI